MNMIPEYNYCFIQYFYICYRDDLSNNNFDSLGEANLEEYQDNEDYLNKDTDDDSIFNEKPRNDRNDRSVADTNTNEKESQHHDNFLTQDNYKNLQKKW